MKTYRILPWYFLLLIVILCGAVMLSTTEGMVTTQIIDKSETGEADNTIRMLIEKSNEEIRKKKSVFHVLVVSEKFRNYSKNSYNLSIDKAVKDLKTKLPKDDILLLISDNDKKTNNILSRISNVQLSNNIVMINCNKQYKSSMDNSKRYDLSPPDKTAIAKEVIRKRTPGIALSRVQN
jgi:hypothetical protein